MSKPLKILRLVAFAAVIMLTQSCVEFAEQSTRFVYDSQADTLRIVQVYHGIFGGEKKVILTEKEREQLDLVLDEDKTFFYANWIFEYSAAAARERIREMRQEIDEKDAHEAAVNTAGC